MQSRALAGIGLTLSVACSMRADFDATGFRCDLEERCPAGQACVDGFCSQAAPVVDASVEPVDPVLAPWAATSSLPEARDYNHQHAAAMNGHVYLIGGYGPELAEVATVFYAPANPDGTLAAWASTAALPEPRALSDVVVKDDVIYVIGGANAAVARNSVYRAQVAGGGVIDEWIASSPLPLPLKAHGAVVAGDHVIVVGGGDDANLRRAEVFVARIQDGGALGAWQATMPLPEPRANAGVVYEGGFLYVIGGDDEEEQSQATVLVAPVDPDSGEVGPWSTGDPLPEARWAGTAAHDAGYLYFIAGTGASDSAQVLHAPIEADGVTGAWQLDFSLPGPRRRHATAVLDGVFYVLGGTAGTEVLYADTPDP